MTGDRPRDLQLPLDLGHRPALSGNDFLVAPSNREAVAWVDRWPRWPAPALVVLGEPGCGKTHLAHVWAARSGAALVEPSAIRREEPLAALGGRRCAVLEGVPEALAAGALDERALLHLYNLLGEEGGHLLLTASAPPARWSLRLPDLRSRLGACPAVTLGAPDDGLLAAVLVKLFADRQLRIGTEVVSFLLAHMERSLDSARRLVAEIDAAALAARRRITVPLVRQVLQRTGQD